MSKLYTLDNRQFISEASDTLVAVIDGSTIHSVADFYSAISKALHFPDYFGENLDALDEMLYDLDWIEHDHVLLLITNSPQFLQHEEAQRSQIITLIEEIDNPYFEVCFM
ncbi:hypothetical protein EMGBS15_07260 [Filimonas sp.]|jgi:RNAse (barnase) inhibitor barstar|nr:hypothetical protein EMGBS15_07260 [Filimonas sp.]